MERKALSTMTEEEKVRAGKLHKCRKCESTWSGLKPEHCTVCHETFSGTDAGDKHRTGKHNVKEGPDRRRCKTQDEMRLIPRFIQKPNGIWGFENTRWDNQ